MIFKARERQISTNNILNTDNMADLHGQKMANHQKENHECRVDCNPSVTEGQAVKPHTKESEIMIAADLKLYASPMTILQSCKKTGPLNKESEEKSSSNNGGGGGGGGSSDHMIAADLRKYGNPLDEK